MRKLVGVPARQNNVVHENEHLPFNPLLLEVRLLDKELVDQALVPLRKKHALVPVRVPLHHGLQTGRARGRAHKSDHQVIPVEHLEHEVRYGGRLPAPSGSDRRQNYRNSVEHPVRVPRFEHPSLT